MSATNAPITNSGKLGGRIYATVCHHCGQPVVSVPAPEWGGGARVELDQGTAGGPWYVRAVQSDVRWGEARRHYNAVCNGHTEHRMVCPTTGAR